MSVQGQSEWGAHGERAPAGDRLQRVFASLLLAGLGLLLAVYVWASLSWRMTLDAPLMHYVALLYDRFGLVPYRDVFTMSFPGTQAFHLLIGRVLGWGDAGFRAANLMVMAAQGGVTWAVMRRFGGRVAAGASLIFALVYLHAGQTMILQRDVLGILPLSLALLLVMADAGPAPLFRAGLVGLFCGVAATIKPQLAIGIPLFVLYLLVKSEPSGRGRIAEFLRLSLAAAAGLLLPLMLAFGRVWQQGALPAFLDMTRHYLPLYLRMTGEHVTIAGFNRVLYLLQSYGKLGGLGIWLAPAALGLVVGWMHAGWGRRRARQMVLLVALALLYSLYPLLSGQFWDYHWMPFHYFIVLLAALALAPPDPARGLHRGQQLVPSLVLAVVLLLALAPTHEVYGQLWGQPPRPPSQGRADEIAAFLQAHLQPGDTVQPLDWTGGAVHGLLQARAKLATPYFYDFYFYHHVSSPTIQAMRRRFLASLEASPPRFIVEVTQKRRPSGPDTSSEFPALRAFIAERYRQVVAGDGYLIYERR